MTLSDKKHFDADNHNADYYHGAFLGEEAKTFDQLTPEESNEPLGVFELFKFEIFII